MSREQYSHMVTFFFFFLTGEAENTRRLHQKKKIKLNDALKKGRVPFTEKARNKTHTDADAAPVKR